VALLAHGAVRLPCSLLLGDALPELPPATPATIGDGLLHVGELAIAPARWWPTPRAVVRDPALVRQAARRAAPASDLDTLPGERADEARGLIDALGASTGGLGRAVDRLLGLGPGLTPAGDDVLAGALVALYATHRQHLLAGAVAAAEPERRTTVVSAALLHHAIRGECVPEVAAFLAALDGRGDLDLARRRLLDVGHTSGAALAYGIVHTLAAPAATARPLHRRTPQ
jgi:hypothetical protein